MTTTSSRDPKRVTLHEFLDVASQRFESYPYSSDAPAEPRVRNAVELTVQLVVDLLLDGRQPMRPTVDFALKSVDLAASVKTLWRLDQEHHVISSWPLDKPIAFASWTGQSALWLIHSFADHMVGELFTCKAILDRARGRVQGTCNALTQRERDLRIGAILWETEAGSDAARTWHEEWRQRVAELLPPVSEFPDWQIGRDWKMIELQFLGELRRWDQSQQQSSQQHAESGDPVMMPIAWFEEEFGISVERVRTACRRGHVRSEKRGSRLYASAVDAHHRWPNDVLYLPERPGQTRSNPV